VPVKARLSDGISLILNIDLEEFTKSYQEALKKNVLLEVENGDGKMRVINPQQILYFEDAEGSASESVEAAAAPQQAAEDLPARH
jgi:hypothetical protein